MFSCLKTISVVTLLLLAACYEVFAAEVTGSGATFPYPIYSKWAEAYQAQTGQKIEYNAIGSRAGIKQIKSAMTSFGGSDMPLSKDELDLFGLIQFPIVMAGDVPVVNIDGLKPGDLLLDGPTIAKIYLGEIKAWNDPAIKKLNPKLILPAIPIVVIHRADGSGTTFIWTDYLSKVSDAWKSKVGAGTEIEWPTGIGGVGNDGVIKNVFTFRGAIGYVEFAYAKRNKISSTKVVNREGNAVLPSLISFRAAAAHADWSNLNRYQVLLTNQPGAQTWPISGATFILMQKKSINSDEAAAALKFFDWAYKNGSQLAEELEYVPMPAAAVNEIKKAWKSELPASLTSSLKID